MGLARVQVNLAQVQTFCNRLFQELQMQQQLLDLLIGATPTGEARNKLCDANIHLLHAMEQLHYASKELDKELT